MAHFSARRRLLAATLAMLAASTPLGAQTPDIPVVAVAANMQFAVQDIARLFQDGTGRALRLAFGSTANFARQIEQGAPFQMMLSADEATVFRLAERGFARDQGAIYAIGRLVLFAPHASPLEVDADLLGLERALAAGQITHFAIASPELAPYGRAAEEALRFRGLWARIRPLLVFGENVAQATQFVVAGSSQGGLIPYAFALLPEIGQRGRWALLPEAMHPPLRQRMALLRNARETAQLFYRFMQEGPARAILARHGYALPDPPARPPPS
jgi:molybdate transport system substrate-binding protein